jgi:hypothetical protein
MVTTLFDGPRLSTRTAHAPAAHGAPEAALADFVASQVINTRRNAVALRPFRPEEFGTSPSSPFPAHVEAANKLIDRLRQGLLQATDGLAEAATTSHSAPHQGNLEQMLRQKDVALQRIKQIEKIWAFYLELFGQRQSPFGESLHATDRIALDCYQVAYTGLGRPRSIPSPAPYTYMETGFTPATFRRGIRLSRIGKQFNPFPIVSLPYHRLLNPWTLGAVHHEVSHNLQSDLGLWNVVPKKIQARLQRSGFSPDTARTWARWHKETWADLAGLLLGGPAIVTSLLDVLGRSSPSTVGYHPASVHPTPYLRAQINFELLRRMGFEGEAEQLDQMWRRLYPHPQTGLPQALLESAPRAMQMVVDTICYQPYPQLGNKALAEVIVYKKGYQPMVREAAERMAQGVDPGIIPARFLVGAARYALEQKLASPADISKNFYLALSKR